MKIQKKILIILIIMSTFLSGIIYTNPVHATKTSANSNISTQDFTIASKGAVLIDSSTGKILY